MNAIANTATPIDAPALAALATTDGAFRTGQLDLFATHSATSSHRLLDHRPASHLATARAILGRASARGVGETVGAAEDAWSTTYGSGALLDLGYVVPRSWAVFLTSLHRDGGYSMFPGGEPDAWATGFAALALGRLDPELFDRVGLARWTGSAQGVDGGITWTPRDARLRSGDLRATAFVISALRQVEGVQLIDGYLDAEALVDFVVGHNRQEGGFALNSYGEPCMWGTGAAIDVLEALGIPVPNAAAVVEFVMTYFDQTSGGFRRGPAYDTFPDVWATRQAVRVLRVVAPELLDNHASRIVEFLASCELPGGGSTYTTVDRAGDVLSTAAAMLAGYGDRATAAWLASCVMPGDDGFAYMPARGAEARTSQWATAALDIEGIAYDTDALLGWATRVQNLDGGFGRWEGRSSEPVSTAAVVATLARAERLASLPGLDALGKWVRASVDRLGRELAADAVVAANLVRTATAVTAASGTAIDTTPCLRILDDLGIEGGFRRRPRAIPDLATTYAVLVAHQAVGDSHSLAPARAWARKLTGHPNGVAWSPASSDGGGLLSTALATLIANTAEGATLPDLSL